MAEPVGLYIHIPFCDAKCAYCDFVTFTDQHRQIDRYLESLTAELQNYKDWPIATIFIGGGTPSVLSPAQIDLLLSTIHQTTDTSHLLEATVEANPESATDDRLRAFQNGGINRLSFGFQAAQNRLLERLNRLHSKEKFLEVYASARRLGFKNINIDLMFGLPNQTLDDWDQTLDEVAALSPEHISAYALKVESGTKLAKDGFAVDGDEEADMYLAASSFLEQKGYAHYEISNFSKPGMEARHNLLYWENKNTVGIGVSSASYLNGRRFKNTSRLHTYMEAVRDRQSVIEEESTLEEAERQKEILMLGLRLKKGVEEKKLSQFDVPMTKTFLSQGLAVVEKGLYSLTPKGWLVSNLLFEQLL